MSHWMAMRRRALMAACGAVDVSSLIFSYTGTWTDTVMEIDGTQYRVLQLMSDGTLTLDPRMVNRVPFDVWCVRQGDAGETGKDSPMTLWAHGAHGTLAGDCTAETPDAYHYRAPSGADGADGGWAMLSGVKATTDTYTASVSSPANLNGIISVSNTTRTGTQWFSLPTSNNGAGGAGGAGAYEWECKACGKSGSGSAKRGSTGTPGIVVIRILIA